MPKPKRPLSAYNLFYRFKRQKIVEALAAAGDSESVDKDAVSAVIAAPPGLEGVSPSAIHGAAPGAINDIRRARILKELEGHTDPRDTKSRSHRKNPLALNGAVSFVELGRVMNASWKDCDPLAKAVFEELSLAGRERYRKRVAEFNAQQGQGEGEKEPAQAQAQADKVTSAPAPADKVTSAPAPADKVTSAPAPVDKKDQEPAKRRLPMKKYIAEKVKSTPSPPLKSNGDATASDEAAEAMVQLAAGLVPSKATGVPPTNGNETEPSSAKNENGAEAQGLPCLPPSAAAPAELPPMPAEPQEELLRLHLRNLEAQLAEERLRARLRELEVERSRRLLAESVFLQSNGVSAGLLRQAAMNGRAAALRDHLQNLQAMSETSLKRPSPMVPGSALPGGIDLDGHLAKRQRLELLFAARGGGGFL